MKYKFSGQKTCAEIYQRFFGSYGRRFQDIGWILIYIIINYYELPG